MAFTYDITTDRGKVRLLATDIDAANPVFQDAEIDAFLSMEASDLKRSAALALETIGSNEVLVLKVMSLLEITTDGAAVSNALLARAKTLREQAAFDESSEDGGAFDIAEQVLDPFTLRERFWKQVQRRDY